MAMKLWLKYMQDRLEVKENEFDNTTAQEADYTDCRPFRQYVWTVTVPCWRRPQ